MDYPARMIPKIIHYCWFGRGDIPELYLRCIESWHRYMPDYEYRLWNEDTFDINLYAYSKEAYEAGKYAFVSDVARLMALKEEGGIYLDVDFEVFKPFDDLLRYNAFAGFEGSKTNPVMMGVIGSEPNGEWVSEQLSRYSDRHFVINGKPDLTTNVRFITDYMIKEGFCPNGKEQDFKDLHVFPVEYFSPRLTTGEYIRTNNTYCEHLGTSSWANNKTNWKELLLSIMSPHTRSSIIKLKRKLFG